MAVKKLCSGAEAVVQAMELQNGSSQQCFIRETISKYTKPDTFCDYLAYIAFRVKNAFLALFGQSDWQKARNLLETHISKIIEQRKIVAQIIAAHPDYKKVLQDNINQANAQQAKSLLSVCLYINQIRGEINAKRLESINRLSVSVLVKETEATVRKWANEISPSSKLAS